MFQELGNYFTLYYIYMYITIVQLLINTDFKGQFHFEFYNFNVFTFESNLN